MSYRDDREALRQQVDELRREVEALRGISSQQGSATVMRVEALAQEVTAALARMDKDRDVLTRLATSLAAIRDEAKNEGLLEKASASPSSSSSAAAKNLPSARDLRSDHDTNNNSGSGGRTTQPILKFFGLVTVLIVGLAGVLMLRSPPSPPAPPKPPSQLADLPGGPHHVDPLALLARAEAHTGARGIHLTSIDAWYVSEDGTLDLLAKTYEAHVTFHYEGEAPAAPPIDPSIPLGAPRPSPPHAPHYCVTLDKLGLQTCNAAFLVDPPVRQPHCTMRDVWTTARASGAPAGAVAHLTYKHELWNKAPMWTFHIEHTKEGYEINDQDCSLSSRSRL